MMKQIVQNCISENAATAQDQKEYKTRYNGYIEKYERLSARHDELAALKEEKRKKHTAIERFIAILEKQDACLSKFDEWLWLTTIEKVIVHRDGSLIFKFFNGLEFAG